MQPEFWQKRWADNQIGFHQAQINPYLQRHWSQLNLADDAQVLVPLCGKSLDMLWLAGQGHRVLGVELSRKAAEDFFAGHELTPNVTQRGAFTVFEAGNISLWCGDFFALGATDMVECAGLYDRAALIALPPAMRERYAAHLLKILPSGTRGLLITLEYPQVQIEGPPFAVLEGEAEALLGGRWRLQTLEVADILGESPKFLKAGVAGLQERVYLLDSNG